MSDIVSFSKLDERRQGDAAVVLGAAVYGDSPSPVFKSRIDHAIQLYKSGDVHSIIFTGGRGDPESSSESEVGRQYAVQHGVLVDDIYIEVLSHITEENLSEAKKIGDAYNIDSYTLVSDPLHMKRAVVLARELEMNVVSSPTETSKYQSLRTQIPFLLRETFLLMGYRIVNIFK
ncbi:YdcF family protein [Neobacillus mesonae]|nr:YdcF family protein [Neobacillus mesonae]